MELRLRDLLQCVWIPWYLIVGLRTILLVLAKDMAHIEPAKSLFRTTAFDVSTDPAGTGRRVLAVLYTTATPNCIVLSIDADRQQMLFHQLQQSAIPKMTLNLGARS